MLPTFNFSAKEKIIEDFRNLFLKKSAAKNEATYKNYYLLFAV